MGHMLWKFAKRIFLGLVALVLLLVGGGLAYRAYRHHQIADSTVIDSSKGVDEGMFVKIGGINQWVFIRGQDRDSPVILLLHGGPGVATSPYPRTTLFSWTKDFTLAQWDQRGTGKTYGRSGPLDSSVTIDRMAQDGLELSEFLRARFHKQKIILLGLSWGSILGVHMSKARPDLFYAYVGTGQMVSERDGEPIVYRQVLDEARARNDQAAIAELEKIGPPPYDSQAKLGVQRKWSQAYEPGGQSGWDILEMALFESDATLHDLRDYARGIVDSQNHFFGTDMSGPLSSVDLRTLGKDFAVPTFVFQGADDDIAPVSLAKAYVGEITSPQKKFVAIAGAGHTAMYTKSDDFLRLLVEFIRPLAR